MMRAIRHGLMAGAAGTNALHTATYLDMALRGRAVSRLPDRTVEAVADACGVRVPGTRASRAHRTTGIAALGGIGTGVTVGVAASALRAAGVRFPLAVGGPATGAAAMALGNALPIARGITDPRDWTPADWTSDALPHLAYGITTSAVLRVSPPASVVVRRWRGRPTRTRRCPRWSGGVCAAGGSLVGAAWREAAATHMPSWATALVEDAAALVLTAVAAWPDGRSRSQSTH